MCGNIDCVALAIAGRVLLVLESSPSHVTLREAQNHLPKESRE
jgi:hypothetical protein